MDKTAYHYNKKKIPAETAGKYLYYYPCDDPGKATAWLEGHGFSVLKVSEKEWEALFELDQLEYNSHHKYARHTTPMPEEEEDELPDGQQERLHTDEIPVSETVAEKVDKQALVSKLSEKEQQYLECLDQGLTQKQVAKQFGVSQGYVSMVKQQAQYNLDYKEYRAALKNNDPEFVWKCWDRFSRKMEMPVFLDIEIDYVIGCLHPDDIAHFLYWYYSIGEFVRYTLTYYLYNNDSIAEEKEKYLSRATDEELAWFIANYENEPLLVQIVYIRLIDEVDRRRSTGMSGSDKAAENFQSTIGKKAMALGMTLQEYYAREMYPLMATIHNGRAREFYRFYKAKRLPE